MTRDDDFLDDWFLADATPPSADSAFAPEPYSAANRPRTPWRERAPAEEVAMRATLMALLGPMVSLGFFSPPILFLGPTLWLIATAGTLVAVPLSVVALVYGINALRRTIATGEPGRGWAIFAIVTCSVWFVEFGWLLYSLYRYMGS